MNEDDDSNLEIPIRRTLDFDSEPIIKRREERTDYSSFGKEKENEPLPAHHKIKGPTMHYFTSNIKETHSKRIEDSGLKYSAQSRKIEDSVMAPRAYQNVGYSLPDRTQTGLLFAPKKSEEVNFQGRERDEVIKKSFQNQSHLENIKKGLEEAKEDFLEDSVRKIPRRYASFISKFIEYVLNWWKLWV